MSAPRERWLPENAYRDFWLVVLSVGLLFTAKAALDAANKATHVAHTALKQTAEIQEGRKTGTTITCVITSSILRGSHSFIVASAAAPLPAKVEARLVKEGYPRKVQREQAGVAQADSYIAAIANAVVDASGAGARGLIVDTSPKRGKHGPSAGTVNCSRLKRLTKAG